jgi:AraC-like DNA-binding protein
VDERVDEAVRLVFAGSGFVIGEFDCDPDDWRWRSENWVGTEVHIVFPRTPVWIVPDGREPLLATVNDVLRYDADARYRRRLAASEGDHCTFVLVGQALADELGIDGRPVGGSGRPTLCRRQIPIGAFASQRAVHAALRRGQADPLMVDETTLGLLAALTPVVAPESSRHVPPAGFPDTCLGTDEAVEAVETVRLRLAMPAPNRHLPSLAELAAEVHYSPFHLTRMFRRRTGTTIHAFGRQLRLRRSLDDVLDGRLDLTDVALAHGFCSHSHFTREFRREFGRPPSEVRRLGYVPTT